MRVGIREALTTRKNNPRSDWHAAGNNPIPGKFEPAALRVFDGYCTVTPDYDGPRLRRGDAVFTMGSCFAREIEIALIDQGANVVSLDQQLTNRPEFTDGEGRVRWGFFHRFTPRAIWHEFLIAFDRLEGWDPGSSLLFTDDSTTVDLNYWGVKGSDQSLPATLVRREIARRLVRRAVEAKVIVITLGLTEGWRQTSTGFHINRLSPKLTRSNDDFFFENQDYDDVMESLNEIYELLSSMNLNKDFRMVVTVSPIPMTQTFTSKDVVVANMDSKATLRAAAHAFTSQHDNVHYFPSYEIAMFSSPEMCWRQDKIHIQTGLINHIASTFLNSYYEPGELAKTRTSEMGLLDKAS